MVGNSKRQVTYMSGGFLNSMNECIDDIIENAGDYKKPILVFLAGQDKVISNNCSRNLLKNIATEKEDVKIRLYPKAYHNIHKEPEYKFRQLSEIYEWIYSISDKKKL
jgi:alpha-beta hydrolase superfamily lysophospholipase